MSNPLFGMFSNDASPGIFSNEASPLGRNMLGMAQQFASFANGFRGDPKARVEELLRSGQMTQSQFEELSSVARQLQNAFRR